MKLFRRHRWVTVALCFALAGIAWAAHKAINFTAPAERATEPLRFELIETVYTDSAGKSQTIIHRLDTATGRAWRYLPPIATTERRLPDVIEGWIEIPEIADEQLIGVEERFLP